MALGLRAQDEARIDGPAVEQHGARAALALRAAALRPRQAHLVAQRIEQRAVGRHGHRALAAVDRDRDRLQIAEPAGAHAALSRRSAAARIARLASTRTIACRYSRLPRMSEIGVAISSRSSRARSSPGPSAGSN